MRRFSAFMLASIALAGCSVPAKAPVTPATPPTPAATATPAPLAYVVPLAAMTAAEAAYNLPATAYVNAGRRGLLSEATKARVRPLLIQAKAALDRARAAKSAVDFVAANTLLSGYADQAGRLIPK